MSRPNRRRAVRAVAPVVGLLAAGLLVWQGSYAAFSATTTNPSNSWAAGTVSLTDDDTGGSSTTVGFAMFSSSAVTAGTVVTSGLKPGDTRTNCIKVTNNGTLAGVVKLYVPALTLTQTNALADNLKVTVEEGTGTVATAFGSCTGFAPTSTITTGAPALSALPAAYAGGLGSTSLATSANRFYRISLTVDAAAPNTVQGGTAAAAFQWEIQTP